MKTVAPKQPDFDSVRGKSACMAHTPVFYRITTPEKCTITCTITRYSRSDAYLSASQVAVASPGTLVPWYPLCSCRVPGY